MTYTPPKTLIIFDSNKARSIIRGGPRYDSFDFGSEFEQILALTENNTYLKENLVIAVPELVLEELVQQKINQYKDDKKNFPKIKERFCLLPGVLFENVVLPSDNFDCENHLKPLIETFLKEKRVIIIKIKEEDKKQIFESLIVRVKAGEAPFKGKILNVDNEGSDAGFKDAIIWESIINWENLNEFQNIFLICRDNGFKVKEEFNNKFSGKKFDVIGDFSNLKSTLDEISEDVEIKKYIFSDYFRNQFIDYLMENYRCDLIENFEIIPDTLNIKKAIFQDIIDLKEIAGLDYEENTESLLIINFSFKSNEERFLGEIFFDNLNKEIIWARSDYSI